MIVGTMILTVFSPVTLVVIAALLAMVAIAWRRQWLALCALLAMAAATGMMTPLGANALVAAIEGRAAPRPGECDAPEAVVLLSGGLKRSPAHRNDFDALTRRSLARAFDLLEQPRDLALPLLISGGGGFAVREADVLGALLERLGHGHHVLILERESRTTWENAVGSREALPGVRRVVLASSALHLPRAARVFAEAGFEVCPLPLDSQYVHARGVGALLPQSSSLLKAEAALHELAGELYYRFRERHPGRHTPAL
jgi:uncharacterized SAM-binding protein YcdF (DUF218 family)